MKKEHYYPPPSSASTTSGWTAGRRRFADWLPWKLFQDQMNPDKANHGWFIGRYARECLHILPKLPAALKWPVAPTSVLEWHQVRNVPRMKLKNTFETHVRFENR